MLGVETVVVTALVTCHDDHDDAGADTDHDPGPRDTNNKRHRARSLPDIQEETETITNISSYS